MRAFTFQSEIEKNKQKKGLQENRYNLNANWFHENNTSSCCVNKITKQ